MTVAPVHIHAICDRHGVVRARSRGAFVPPSFVHSGDHESESLPARIMLVVGGLPEADFGLLGRGRNNPLALVVLNDAWISRACITERDFLPVIPWSAASAILVESEENADLIRSDVFADCMRLSVPVHVASAAFTKGSGTLVHHSGGVLRKQHEVFDRVIAAALLSTPGQDRDVVPVLRTPNEGASWAVDRFERRQEKLGLPGIEFASSYVATVLRELLDGQTPRSTADLFDICLRVSQERWASQPQIQAWVSTMAGAKTGDEAAIADLRMGDGKSILLRALMLAVLRDSQARILLSRSDSLMSGDAVVEAALTIHGLMIGLGGIDGQSKEGSRWLQQCWEAWIDDLAPSRNGKRLDAFPDDAGADVQAPGGTVFESAAMAVAEPSESPAAVTGSSVDQGSFVAAWAACGVESSPAEQLLLGQECGLRLGMSVTAHVPVGDNVREIWVMGAPPAKRLADSGWDALRESKHAHHSRRALLTLMEAAVDGRVRPCLDGGRLGFRVEIEPGSQGVAKAVAEAVGVLRNLGWIASLPVVAPDLGDPAGRRPRASGEDWRDSQSVV